MSLITLADEEQNHLHKTFEKYKPYTSLADATVELFGGMVVSVRVPAPSFVAFYSQAKKHSALGFFSLMRGHRSQYKLTLRYFLEALVQAAYASFHTDHSEYFDTESMQPIKQKVVVRRANKWLFDTYPTVSAHIKEIKDRINNLSSHSNFVSTFMNFKLADDGTHDTPFFDYENELVTKADLLECTRVASIAIDLLLACSKDTGLIVLWPETQKSWGELSHHTDDLFAELTADPRWAQFIDDEE